MRRVLAAAGWVLGTAAIAFMAWQVIAAHGGQTP